MDRIICNPIDLPYRYQDMVVPGFARVVCREGADPSLVRFRGRYYLFVSMSGGFWHSPDLVAWEFVATPGLPILDYAPDVREIDGALVFTASNADRPCSFWRTTDPLSGEFEEIPGPFPFWDPNLFQDDDGRVYLYWGCSNDQPIRGVELDRATLKPLGEPTELFGGDDAARGWERFGEADGTNVPDGASPYGGDHRDLHNLRHSFPTRRSSDLEQHPVGVEARRVDADATLERVVHGDARGGHVPPVAVLVLHGAAVAGARSEAAGQ
jgi:hypothetical protein